jgi:hypothetical protein
MRDNRLAPDAPGDRSHIRAGAAQKTEKMSPADSGLGRPKGTLCREHKAPHERDPFDLGPSRRLWQRPGRAALFRKTWRRIITRRCRVRQTGHALANPCRLEILTMKCSNVLIGSVLVLTLSLAAGPQQATAQEWQRVTGEMIGVQIRPRCNGLVLGVLGAAKHDGARVVQWGSTGSADQLWDIKRIGSFHRIVNRNSGKVLDVAGYSTNNGAPIHQWGWHIGNNQLWYIESRIENVPNFGPLRVYRMMNVHSHRYLDVPDGSADWGVQMIQWAWNGGSNQQFWLP